MSQAIHRLAITLSVLLTAALPAWGGEPKGAADQATSACDPKTSVAADRDVFGITMLNPTRQGTRVWTSEHWSNRSYAIDDLDPHDPHHISGKRGNGTLTVSDGVLTMSGSQPRLYIYPFTDQLWRDAELTVYYMRVADRETKHAGMVAGMRSGRDGHGSAPCTANTYYGRMRHDGAFDFAKELQHPRAQKRDTLPPEKAWPDGKLPRNIWIGFKLIAYNDGDRVHLEVHRDLTGGKNGGTWEKINSSIDEGNWFAQTDCADHHPQNGRSDMRILDGGTIFVRNTDVQDARYRWVSIREIQPVRPNGAMP